jgi:hypothetical protein
MEVDHGVKSSEQRASGRQFHLVASRPGRDFQRMPVRVHWITAHSHIVAATNQHSLPPVPS